MSTARLDPRKRPAPGRGAAGLLLIGALLAVLLAGCMSSVSQRGISPITAHGFGRAGVRAQPALPGSLPSIEEELWVVARAEPASPPAEADAPGSGELVTKTGAGETVPLPLEHTAVRATISGYIAAVQVTQQFRNPYDGKIEAIYVFPLPHNAAVDGFVMTIGERRIRGIIRERSEAEAIYQAAKSQGYVASLLTQERPNIFTQAVANLEPGHPIDVTLTYFHTLAYDDGWYEFVFPTVVGPRFNPPGSTAGIGAVARGQPGRSGQRTEVQYLRPGERSGHDLALEVHLDAGVALEEISCRTHTIAQQRHEPGRATVTLSPADHIPNRDFVLRYRVAGDRIKSDFLAHREERGGYFTLMLYPPQSLAGLSRQPLELVFVLDCSGSMSGQPLAQAKAAIQRALRRLEPSDTFQIVRFSNEASQLGPSPLPASPENVHRGLAYLAELESEGGTMMINGIKAALDFPHDPARLRFVTFLTDGYIGNEVQILDAIRQRLGPARIFSFGVGSAVNRYLLEHMAKAGRGAVAYLGLRTDAAEVMDRFFDRIAHPALTDLTIDWGDLRVTDVFPRQLPDLFVGRPVILAGRFDGTGPATLRVSGLAGGQPTTFAIPITLAEAEPARRALPAVWARLKIADLADQAVLDPDHELVGAVRQVALDYGLMSAYTAFVAVDTSRRTAGTEATTVPVAVPVPEGVKYRTTVGEE
ncbi:MAG: VWA domain-containing protein [Verrucomicrobia bacterium]|nr:VWA domain-containing protein [Verrucomicrobiota bacterium]